MSETINLLKQMHERASLNITEVFSFSECCADFENFTGDVIYPVDVGMLADVLAESYCALNPPPPEVCLHTAQAVISCSISPQSQSYCKEANPKSVAAAKWLSLQPEFSQEELEVAFVKTLTALDPPWGTPGSGPMVLVSVDGDDFTETHFEPLTEEAAKALLK